MQPTRPIQRIKLFFITGIFIFPVVVGWLLYHFNSELHFKTLNHGNLLNPPVSVSTLWKSDGKWQIVYVPKNCDINATEQKMFLLHQLRIALNSDSNRISLVVVKDAHCANLAVHDFRAVTLTQADFTKWEVLQKNKIYLVDPKSNLFMSYPSDSDAMNIFNDLKRVLEVSQIG